MWEDFVKYNLIRTNLLKTFVNTFGAEELPLPYFLQSYAENKSIFLSWLEVEKAKREDIDLGYYTNPKFYKGSTDKEVQDLYNRISDYEEEWWNNKKNISWLKELFPDMFRAGYDIKELEKDVPNFSPLSIEEFYKITKGKYYLGYDLDEDLGTMIPYVKDIILIEDYYEEIGEYFKFRYDNFDFSLLCEYCSFPFGVHESRAMRYRKEGLLEFGPPREMTKYPVKDLFNKYYTGINIAGTRLINIRGTNGSGKTTMVTNIYEESKSLGTAKEKTFMLTDAKGKEHKRYYDVLEDKNIILMGGYNSPYGTKGTDRIGDVYEILQGIIYLVCNYPGHTIIMESATVSTSFWAYAILFSILKDLGVEINIVSLWIRDSNFLVNNIKNRTVRKPGAKEPDYKGVIDKLDILYKNHFRFSTILGKDSCMVMFPDSTEKEQMHIVLHTILENNTKRGLLGRRLL